MRCCFQAKNLETSVKSILEGHGDHMLAEAKSEIIKQECKMYSLNTCIHVLQRQAHYQWLELDDAVGMKNLDESKSDWKKNWL